MKNQNTNTTHTMMQTAQTAVYLALRARHKNSPTQFLTDLQNAQTADNTARNLQSVCDRIHELERERDQYRKDSAQMKNYSQRIRITEEERETAVDMAHIYTKQADRLSDEIEGLYTKLDTTFSDREDLVQDALIALLEVEQNPAEITENMIDRYTAEHGEELTADDWEELQQIANFRHVVSYVGKCISRLSAPDALNRHTTKSTRATADEVAQWVDLYGDTGASVKAPNQIKRTRASDCFDTMEYKEYKDPSKTGFYRVRHWVTVAPYSYIETYADRDTDTDTEQTAVDNLGEIVGYTKSYNPFVTDTGTAEQWERILATANLTDRERTWLHHFFNRARYADFDECKQYAFEQIGITKATNQTTFMNRMKNRLNPKTK